MPNSLALALCVHHKPWLAMSTLVTALLQDDQTFDIQFLHNLGDGHVRRPSYARYDALLGDDQGNSHLSAYEPAVRDVCTLASDRVASVDYENDHTLDSGAFYKFIRDGRWTAYDHVLFAGEGTLFARPGTLSSVRRFARETPAHFIQSGHEQRRLPKRLVLEYSSRHPSPTPMDRFHDEMIAETFGVFCRDAALARLVDAWNSDFQAETQNHVPVIPPRTRLGRRLRRAIVRRLGAPHETRGGRLAHVVRQLPYQLDYAASRVSLWVGRESAWPSADVTRWGSIAQVARVNEVVFHRVTGPEWFGCTPTLLLSRTFLERLVRRMEEHRMFDVLDLPFAATGLELLWGFLPAWLGFDKWFTDGFHRVRKDFVTYRREDHAPDMASYLNRYHRGRVSVAWQGERLKVRSLKPGLEWLRDVLPPVYF